MRSWHVRSAEYHVLACVLDRTLIVGRALVEVRMRPLPWLAARLAARPACRPAPLLGTPRITRRWESTDTSAFTLRPYQEECVTTCLEALAQGATRIGVSSPTGSGKTTMFTELLARMPAAKGGGTQTLILVNAVALVDQAYTTVRRLLPHLHVERDQGTKHKASGVADVTVATVQSLRSPLRLDKYDPWRFKCVIVDEAHHSTSDTYRKVLFHFHTDVHCPDAAEADVPVHVPIIGFSATFSRHDGLALGTVYDQIVFHKDFLTMIQEKW